MCMYMCTCICIHKFPFSHTTDKAIQGGRAAPSLLAKPRAERSPLLLGTQGSRGEAGRRGGARGKGGETTQPAPRHRRPTARRRINQQSVGG